jgi:four helix bundle protein
MRDFRKLDIWKNGITIVTQVYELSEKLPLNEKFGLRSQITRAAVSIPSNIAEGSSRNSEVEFKRFLEIAMGSLFELETQLIITEELKFIKSSELELTFLLIQKEAKMINSLIQKIKRTKSQITNS